MIPLLSWQSVSLLYLDDVNIVENAEEEKEKDDVFVSQSTHAISINSNAEDCCWWWVVSHTRNRLVYLRDRSAVTTVCCHTRTEVEDQSFYITKSQFTDPVPVLTP